MSNEQLAKEFSQNPIYRGFMDIVTKALLGILVYLGTNMNSDLTGLRNSNADLLNRVIEINVKLDNNNARITELEKDVKTLEKEVYRLSNYSD